MIWKDEQKYDKIIDGMALGYGVPAPLIKAIIAKESSFNHRAMKPELQIQDASRGLMQVLARTARALGFKDDIEKLYDPAINILYGTKLLKENLERTKGNLAQAVAAYNAGWKWFINKKPIPNQDYVNYINVYTAYFAGRLPESDVKTFQRSKIMPKATLFF